MHLIDENIFMVGREFEVGEAGDTPLNKRSLFPLAFHNCDTLNGFQFPEPFVKKCLTPSSKGKILSNEKNNFSYFDNNKFPNVIWWTPK